MLPHSDVLRLLFPLELGGVHELDDAVVARALDAAQARVDDLHQEMFPDTSSELIDRWEKRYGIPVNPLLPLPARRALVVARKRNRGRLRLQFYIDLASSLGYTITIAEAVDGDLYKWRVTVAATPIYEFRAGDSAAGDRLLDWDVPTAVEGIFEELKPADSQVVFAYA